MNQVTATEAATLAEDSEARLLNKAKIADVPIFTGKGEEAVRRPLADIRSDVANAKEKQLRSEVLVARGSVMPGVDDLNEEKDKQVRKRTEEFSRANPDRGMSPAEKKALSAKLEKLKKGWHEEYANFFQLLPVGIRRGFRFRMPWADRLPAGKPVHLRFKLEGFQDVGAGDNVYEIHIQAGPLDSPHRLDVVRYLTSGMTHEIPLHNPGKLLDDKGFVTVYLSNLPGNNLPLILPFATLQRNRLKGAPEIVTNGNLELLYYEAGFGVNLVRSLAIIMCWLGLLTALGLTASSFMAFPTAAFVSLSMLILVFSGPLMAEVVDDGTIMQTANTQEGTLDKSFVDWYALPVFKFWLYCMEPITGLSPIDSLSSGRSISWGTLGKSYLFTLIIGGTMSGLGMVVFTKRQLALAGTND